MCVASCCVAPRLQLRARACSSCCVCETRAFPLLFKTARALIGERTAARPPLLARGSAAYGIASVSLPPLCTLDSSRLLRAHAELVSPLFRNDAGRDAGTVIVAQAMAALDGGRHASHVRHMVVGLEDCRGAEHGPKEILRRC